RSERPPRERAGNLASVTRWPAPPLPELPGPRGDRPTIRLHDTASGALVPAATGPEARLYVCGITPYDATHLGHASTYLAFDLLEQGYAYRVPGDGVEPDGDVYFSVHADPAFGEVSHLDEPAMLDLFTERGGDPGRAGKKHPLDALLWRVERPGEPSWNCG